MKIGIWASGLDLGLEAWIELRPQGKELGLEEGIWALRQGFGPGDTDFGLRNRTRALEMGFVPLGMDLSLKAGIWTLGQGVGPRSRGGI